MPTRVGESSAISGVGARPSETRPWRRRHTFREKRRGRALLARDDAPRQWPRRLDGPLLLPSASPTSPGGPTPPLYLELLCSSLFPVLLDCRLGQVLVLGADHPEN